MIHSKNHKSGFSFIEIMAAITLLGIFGSSLFLVQSNMFAKIFKTHQMLFFNQDFIYDMAQLKNKITQAVAQKQPIDTITIQEDKKNPDRKVSFKLLKISEQSELQKFSKNMRIVETEAVYENKYTMRWFSLMYIPTAQNEKEESKNPEPNMKPS